MVEFLKYMTSSVTNYFLILGTLLVLLTLIVAATKTIIEFTFSCYFQSRLVYQQTIKKLGTPEEK